MQGMELVIKVDLSTRKRTIFAVIEKCKEWNIYNEIFTYFKYISNLFTGSKSRTYWIQLLNQLPDSLRQPVMNQPNFFQPILHVLIFHI